MTGSTQISSHEMQFIHGLGHDQVAGFIADQQKNRALTVLVKQLNTTLLHGPADQSEAARIALEKLGFIDI